MVYIFNKKTSVLELDFFLKRCMHHNIRYFNMYLNLVFLTQILI